MGWDEEEMLYNQSSAYQREQQYMEKPRLQ